MNEDLVSNLTDELSQDLMNMISSFVRNHREIITSKEMGMVILNTPLYFLFKATDHSMKSLSLNRRESYLKEFKDHIINYIIDMENDLKDEIKKSEGVVNE